MTDPIGTTASAVTILDRVAAAIHWVLGKRGGKRQRFPAHYQHRGFELKPVGLHFYLAQAQPRVELGFYAVNYLRRELVLTEVEVSQFNISGGPLIEHVPLVQEFTISARDSFMVFCRRTLMDSEIRMLLAELPRDCWSGSIALSARAKAGRREYTFGPIVALAIEGWLHRPP